MCDVPACHALQVRHGEVKKRPWQQNETMAGAKLATWTTGAVCLQDGTLTKPVIDFALMRRRCGILEGEQSPLGNLLLA